MARAPKRAAEREPREERAPMIDRTRASWYGPPALRRQSDLPEGALAILAAIMLAGSAASIAGCGPIEYINQVGVKAAGAVSAAKLAQADRYAPYEYTAAEEYLHKAREEASYAEYEDAIEFGRKAEELADKGRAIAVAKLSQSAGASRSTEAVPASGATTPASESRAPGPRPASEDENPK
jgi:hypothetical protein